MKIRHRFPLLRVWSESLFPSPETKLIEDKIWLWIFHGGRQARGVRMLMKLRRRELKIQRKGIKGLPTPTSIPEPLKGRFWKGTEAPSVIGFLN
jgi:hypothetical protein